VQTAPWGEQRDPARGQQHPQSVERATGPCDGDGEWPNELDRHRDAEGETVQRLVEHEVHQSGRQSEQDRVCESAARVVADVGTPHGDEHNGGKPDTHEGGAAGAQRGEQIVRHR
jgi:hypothetical protein